MGVVLLSLLGIAILLPFGLVLFGVLVHKKRQAYFKKAGIPYLGFRLQKTLTFFSGSVSVVQAEEEIYDTFKKCESPLVAYSDPFGAALLVVTDLELLKHIFVKDFDHFVNRRPVNTKRAGDYFKKMLFTMESEPWKAIRAKLSPSFTTGRIRNFCGIFKASSDRMEGYLKKQMQYPTKRSMDGDFAQFISKYAMDVIANCVFGVDSKTWEFAPQENSYFEKMGKEFGFKFSPKALFRILIVFALPQVADWLGIEAMGKEPVQYFSKVVREVIKNRRETGERPEDFLQLMLDAQDGLLKADEETNQVMNGTTSDNEKILKGDAHSKVTFDDDDVIANALLFLMAGFDTTQTALLFTLYSLALEPEIQEKLYKEVSTVLKKYDGVMSYEAILEMHYLDMVINETLRFYSPATRTERLCTKDYTVPGTNLKIEKGSIVMVPIMGIHRDPQHYPHPDKFIPERFTHENKADRHAYAYLPFGIGPRNCIGMRFALIKVKVAIAQLVATFQFSPCARTKIPIEFDVNAAIKPKGGMWLNYAVRE